MTSDHQAINTMHTPLPNQQQVSAKDLHKVCNELGVLSVADEGGDCGQYSPGDMVGGHHSQSNGHENGQTLMAAASMASEQHLGTMNNNAMAKGVDESVEQNGAASSIGSHQTTTATSRQNSDTSLSTASSIEGSERMHSVPNGAGEQLHVQVENLNAANPSCPITDQSMLSSSTECLDGQLVNGGTNPASTDGVQSAQWPGYELSVEDLKTRLRHQLEYYLSRENLAADTYLRTQMDSDQFVKVSILASFNMVRRLTTDMNLILQALRESPCLQLDENGEKVRPVHKRCTLILREIPENTERKEVEDLFASPMCPKIISCEYALNNIWYVNFETDEDAQKAFLYLRQQVQNFKGKPILARIKTAPIPRVQNGYRPVPPNSLPLQSSQQGTTTTANGTGVSTPNTMVTALSPATETVAVPLPFPPSTVVTPVGSNGTVTGGAMTPGDNGAGCVVVCTNSATLPGSAGIAALPPSNIYYYSTGGGQTAIVAAPGHHAPTVVTGPAAAAAVLSPTWPSAGPNSFDLGYILAVNGYQAQGAYRPALLVPAAPIPAQVAAAVGHRFVSERPRKPRPNGGYYQQHGGERGPPANTTENVRPTAPQPYNRYGGPSNSSRPSNGGNYAEGRTPYYRNENNIHYNNIRNRPNRQPSGNGNGNGTGPGTASGTAAAAASTTTTTTTNGTVPRRFPQSRYTDRYSSTDYWSSSSSLPKERKPTAPTAASTSATTVNGTVAGATDGKKNESFDLLSSSFPPLPTTSAEQDEAAAPISGPEEPSTTTTGTRNVSQSQAASSQGQQQRVEKEQSSVDPATVQTTTTAAAVVTAAAATAKVRPRIMQEPVPMENGDDHSKSGSVSPPTTTAPTQQPLRSDGGQVSGDCAATTMVAKNKPAEETKSSPPTASMTNEMQPREQRMMQKPFASAATMTTTAGMIRAGTNSTIPVAVVPPHAQPKLPRVSTADKATVTDSLPTCPKKVSTEERSTSVATMTTSNMHSPNLDDGVSSTEEKTINDCSKKLSYAEMAKHANPRNASFAAAASQASTEKLLSTNTPPVGISTTVMAPASVKEQRSSNNEDGGRRWASRAGANGQAPMAATNGQAQGRYNNNNSAYPRDSSHKYNRRNKNSQQQGPFRNRDYQQQQDYGSSQYQEISSPPATS